MKKIFIDGKEGTTGLRIFSRLESRSDLTFFTLPEALRKDPTARRDAILSSDAAFLCLPDAAATESAELAGDAATILIDTSTAHRTQPDWAYGFPELGSRFRNQIAVSRRIAVPGCHASGFIALVQPLVEAGLLAASARITCHSITGYSGGGKKMIFQYEDEARDALLDAPRQYGLTQQHKHLKEMQKITGLQTAPVFCPIVSDFYSGMTVTVPLFKEDLGHGFTAADIKELYRSRYTGPVVTYRPNTAVSGFISALDMHGLDSMTITVEGGEERILLIAQYDNLGKGASGAAIQCLNIALGIDEALGLNL